MANISYKETLERLEKLINTTTKSEFCYDLLRIFAQTTETSINRIKEGKGNLSKDGVTVLVRSKIAYRAATSDTMRTVLEALKTDAKIAKANPRLFVVSDGITILAYDPKKEDEYENNISAL